MLNNDERKDLIRLLLDDPAAVMYPDNFIYALLDMFNTSEMLLVVMILTDMTIDYKKLEKFIKIMGAK